MASSSVVIKSKSANGKILQKSITFINPNADNKKIVEGMKKLNALSTNEYIETSRIDKYRCDDD